MLTFELPINPPYSYERLRSRLESHPDQQFQLIPECSMLRRAFRIETESFLVTLAFKGGLETPVLQVQTDKSLSAAQQEKLRKTVRHMFQADVDLEPVYQHMQTDQRLAPLTERFRGLRFLLDPDLFQSMVRTIIGQQLNLAFAATLTERLLTLAGDVVHDEQGQPFHVFPTAEAIARLEIEQLRQLQFSQRKAEYIIDFARAVVNRRVELDRLELMSDEEAIGYLTALRGIGRWTVECLLMFGMGRPDLLPAADIGLRNGIQLVYDLPEKPDEAKIRAIGESWAPWRSYISLYVWEAFGAFRRGEFAQPSADA
ncbi:DNA-3-methyladenine glycosylase 2 [Brevibacillus fulvus]|uniref:DNA-3-methyladenine glycosylase II n=1 Tax=Brevibacillus fulvus TaxID=1125967 RepID=A0A939BUN6_9BACL|nr:DNA-3-methyladenine glycosylase 2 [Brevibacillus fulvus]MBM7589771.1 DNA-3-methyladenine glycosylase II [Brevibacillus fulvus]